MRSFWIFALGILSLYACQNEADSPESSEKSVQEIPTEGGNDIADIIRNPISADRPLDTVNVARMDFDEANYDFGSAREGDVVKHIFRFTNVGQAPLVINNAKSTCGCTVPEWPKAPIPAGETGEIEVNFNTKGKKGYQDKPITISANTNPPQTVIHLKGSIKPKPE
ncbi:MAG: DUF1573 domain-containing protein [Bacteroidota bacterium]